MCFIIYKVAGLLIGIIPILIIAGLTLALTFYRPNNKPFINMLEASIKYAMQDKLYIWQRRKNKKIKEVAEKAEELKIGEINRSGVKLSGSKLRDLAWSLDVLDLQKQKDK